MFFQSVSSPTNTRALRILISEEGLHKERYEKRREGVSNYGYRSDCSVCTLPIRFTTDIPFITRPKIVCFPVEKQKMHQKGKCNFCNEKCTIKPRTRSKSDKKLTSIGVWSSVSHGKNTSPSMLQIFRDLISKSPTE